MALAGLLTVMYACLEVKTTLGGRSPHLLYCLVTAMRPRMLMTIDEEGKLLPVSVRVGQAVDVVAQVRSPPLSLEVQFATFSYPCLMCVKQAVEVAAQVRSPISPFQLKSLSPFHPCVRCVGQAVNVVDQVQLPSSVM